MIIKKVIITLLVLLILYIISKNNENFYTIPKPDSHLLSMHNKTNNISETYIKTDDMNLKAKVNKSMINLDPNSGDDKHINVGNDIIIKKGFKLDKYPHTIDISFLRYIKYLPVHFEKEFCLKDSKGTDCINKKHVEVVKGERKINLKTYPENKRRCLGAKNILHKKSINQGPSGIKVFGDQPCKNGNTGNEFEFNRERHIHSNENETHFHSHIINDEPHSHII